MKLGANTKIESIYYFLDESGYSIPLTPNTFSYFIKVGGRVINNSAKDVPKILDYLKSRYAEGGLTMKAPKLLAPNGKPTNLTPEQYRLVRTPAFKNWFGDWESSPENASKVIDENGEPLVVYHGTDEEFTVFDVNAKSKWLNQKKLKHHFFRKQKEVH